MGRVTHSSGAFVKSSSLEDLDASDEEDGVKAQVWGRSTNSVLPSAEQLAIFASH